jgi:hypothetical protein
MFEPEDGQLSTGQPEPEEGSQLQRFLSQLGSAAGPYLDQLNNLNPPSGRGQQNYPSISGDYLSVHGRPYDLGQPEAVSGDAMARVRPLLEMAGNRTQASAGPFAGHDSRTLSGTSNGTITPNQDLANTSGQIDHSAYMMPGVNRFFRDGYLGNPVSGNNSWTRSDGSGTSGPGKSSALGDRILAAPAGSNPNQTPASGSSLPLSTLSGEEKLSRFAGIKQVAEPANQDSTDSVTSSNVATNSSANSLDTNPRQTANRTGTNARPDGQAIDKPVTTPNAVLGHSQSRTTGAPRVADQENSASSNHSKKPESHILKGKVGVKEAGADNQYEDVKFIQQLLNAAVDSGDVPGDKLAEDGNVTPQMLKMIDEYQNQKFRGFNSKTPSKLRVINERSSTLKALKKNPFWDQRWSGYDGLIKKEVVDINNEIANKHFQDPNPLDWRMIKAMLWQESGGPDFNGGKEWKIWPMQIGRRKADTGIQDVISGRSHTDLFTTNELRKEMSTAFHNHRMTPELNIKAAIIYLLGRRVKSENSVAVGPPEDPIRVKNTTPWTNWPAAWEQPLSSSNRITRSLRRSRCR